jgi:insulysin
MREAKMAVEKSEVEIVKPRNDKREYRRVLLPNSMEVCLISDPDTDKVSSLSPSRYF